MLRRGCTWMSSGAATTYGTFLADRMALAISAWRPPSIVPAGPPTSCARSRRPGAHSPALWQAPWLASPLFAALPCLPLPH